MKYHTIIRSIVVTIVILTNTHSFSQVGIGTTTPNPSAALDITSATRGLLLPRVELTNTTLSTPLTSHVAGMTVYNIAPAINDVTPGLYYNDGTKWISIDQTQNNDWSLTGNSGTAIGTNFLGTTDNVDLSIKTANTERIRVKNNGKIGIAESNPTHASLEIGGNLIIGDTYTGGTAVAKAGGATIEGRTIIGDDHFYYEVYDKFVVYGNTNSTPTSITDGDNGSGLEYAINAYTSNGTGIYAEDLDGGVGLESIVYGTTTNRAVGAQGRDASGEGTGVLGISQFDDTDDNIENPTKGHVGVQGLEATITNLALLSSGDAGHTAAIVSLSDKRFKKNIKPIKNALEIIKQIKPTTYDMRWENKKYRNIGLSRTPQMGFIAQELEEVLPNLVTDKTIPLNDHIYTKSQLSKNPDLQNKEGSVIDVKMVNYIQIVPLLTQAIKEQQTLIAGLEARIQSLER